MNADHSHEFGSDGREQAQQVLLCGGALGIALPSAWRLSNGDFSSATFLPETIEHAALRLDVASYEDPAAVGNDDLGRFLEDEVKSIYPKSELSGRRGIVLKGTWVDQSIGCHRQVWRVMKSFYPDHVRVATYTFDVPLSLAGAESTERLARDVEAIVESTAFSGRLTALDRVAPTEDMKRLSLWDLIHMRVPSEWRFVRENDGSSAGMYRGEPEDETARGDEAFWVDLDEFARQHGTGSVGAPQGRKVIEELATGVTTRPELANHAPQLEYLADGGGLVSYRYERNQDGRTLIVYRWFRFTLREGSLVMATFLYVTAKRPVQGTDTPEAANARAALLDREIRNAIIGDPGETDKPSVPIPAKSLN